MASGISSVIITKNEAANIAECIRALSWTQEIIVIDDFSEDDTAALAAGLGAKVYEFSGGYARAKNYGIEMATNPWILSVDADEVIPEALAKELEAAAAKHEYNGYYIPRRNHMSWRWIKHAGYYPDLQLRFFKKSAGRFKEVKVHERVIVEGETGVLSEAMLHATYKDTKDFFKKVERYAQLDGEQAVIDGVNSSYIHIILAPKKQFLVSLFKEGGYKEGMLGVTLATGMARYAFIKHKYILSAGTKEG